MTSRRLMSREGQQQALHVTDYYCAKALAELRAMGACGKKTRKKLTDTEFDHDMYSQELGDGPIY
jgi:hypothetical protein